MSLEIRPLDITEYKGDAIVNSLGIRENINVYGKICASVVKKSRSKELKDIIAGHKDNAEPGYMFITNGYNLPSKNIIHICTPYYSHDKHLFALEYVYKLALVTAYKNKWHKVAIPIMGTGANGYPHDYVLKLAVELSKAFSSLHKEMQITLCMPVVSAKEFNEKFDENKINQSIEDFFKEDKDLESREFIYDKASFKHLDDFRVPGLLEYSIYEIKEACFKGEQELDFQRRNPNGAHENKGKLSFLPLKEALLDGGVRPVSFDMTKLSEKSVTFYIEKYIETRFANKSDQTEIRRNVNKMLSGSNESTSLKTKHGNEKKRTTITMSMLMRYVLSLHMTKEEATDFLLFCGKAFSPVSKEDKIYEALIDHKKYVTNENDVYKINGFCLKHGINQIFDYLPESEAL